MFSLELTHRQAIGSQRCERRHLNTKVPGSRPRFVVETRRAERGVECLFGGSKHAGRSIKRTLQPPMSRRSSVSRVRENRTDGLKGDGGNGSPGTPRHPLPMNSVSARGCLRVLAVGLLLAACVLDILYSGADGSSVLPTGAAVWPVTAVLFVGLAALLWPAARRPTYMDPRTPRQGHSAGCGCADRDAVARHGSGARAHPGTEAAAHTGGDPGRSVRGARPGLLLRVRGGTGKAVNA